MNITVFCASSTTVDPAYHEDARRLGELIARAGHTLIYGGGSVGLMGTMARSVHANGGRVVGFIPRRLQQIEGRAYDIADELVVTPTMHERKQNMFARADAFIILAGGIGTLEEFLEVLTLRKLGYHDRPIALVNTKNLYAPLLELFTQFENLSFTGGLTNGESLYVASDAEDAYSYVTAAVSADADPT